MTEPRDLAQRAEEMDAPPPGDGERLMGYSVMVPFKSGHVLSLRRFPVTTISGPYTSVWHRDPGGEWTFYQDSPPLLACPRYFGANISKSIEAPVTIDWRGPRSLSVEVADLSWSLDLTKPAVTRLLDLLTRLTPERVMHSRFALRGLQASAPALGLGRASLIGVAPNGQRFRSLGRNLWMVAHTRATLGNHEFGPPGALREQARIGEYWIPQRGVFAVADAWFETLDLTRHQSSTAGAN